MAVASQVWSGHDSKTFQQLLTDFERDLRVQPAKHLLALLDVHRRQLPHEIVTRFHFRVTAPADPDRKQRGRRPNRNVPLLNHTSKIVTRGSFSRRSCHLWQVDFLLIEDFPARAVARLDRAVHEAGKVAVGARASKDKSAIKLRSRGRPGRVCRRQPAKEGSVPFWHEILPRGYGVTA